MKRLMIKPGTNLSRRVDGTFYINALLAQGWVFADQPEPVPYTEPEEVIPVEQPAKRKRGRPKKVKP